MTLNIYHEGDEEAKDIVIPREVIHVKSIRFEMKEGISRISGSTDSVMTADEFERSVRSAVSAKAQDWLSICETSGWTSRHVRSISRASCCRKNQSS